MRRFLMAISILSLLACMSGRDDDDDDDDRDDGGGGNPWDSGGASLAGHVLYPSEEDVLSVNLATMQVERLVEGATSPRRALNGDIVYLDDCWAEDWETCQGDSLRVLPADGGESEVVVAEGIFWSAALSPDGEYVAAEESCDPWTEDWCPEDDFWGVLVRARAGGRVVAALQDDTADPTWTPDGRLVYIGYEPGVFYVASADLESFDRIETGLDDVSEIDLPDVSPDGEFVAFCTGEGLYVIGMDGSDLRQLTDAWCQGAAFSPDGDWIAHTSWQMQVVPLAGGEPVGIEPPDDADAGFDVSPDYLASPLSWY